MKNLKVYKVLSYILLPFGGLLGVVALFGVLASLGNPLMMLMFLIVVCVALYIFSSFRFLNRVIIQQIKSRPSLKDFVRVNTFISIFFSVYTLYSAMVALNNPDLMKTAIQQMMAMPQFAMPPGYNEASFLHIFKISYIIFGIFCALLMLHSSATLFLLKQYKSAFEEE